MSVPKRLMAFHVELGHSQPVVHRADLEQESGLFHIPYLDIFCSVDNFMVLGK